MKRPARDLRTDSDLSRRDAPWGVVLLSATLVAAAVAGALCGCEDDDGGRTVTTQVLADGSTQTVETVVLPQSGGTLATQITTTVVQPDGTSQTEVTVQGGVLSIMLNPAQWSSTNLPDGIRIPLGTGGFSIGSGSVLTNPSGGSSGGSPPPSGGGGSSGTVTTNLLSLGMTNQP